LAQSTLVFTTPVGETFSYKKTSTGYESYVGKTFFQFLTPVQAEKEWKSLKKNGAVLQIKLANRPWAR
jgi:hypothetical protein